MAQLHLRASLGSRSLGFGADDRLLGRRFFGADNTLRHYLLRADEDRLYGGGGRVGCLAAWCWRWGRVSPTLVRWGRVSNLVRVISVLLTVKLRALLSWPVEDWLGSAEIGFRFNFLSISRIKTRRF